MAKRPAIEVEGYREMKKLIRKIGDEDLREMLKQANYEAAKIVADEAQKEAPKVSGRLAASIRPNRAVGYGAVRAGSAARVPYAGPINYGWPARGIKANDFMQRAVKNKLGEARKHYTKQIRRLAKRLES
jgi:hypothetical protein